MSYSILLDALVIVAYFAIILGIGLAQRSRSGSVEGFALGDRQIAWWAVLRRSLPPRSVREHFSARRERAYALRNFTYVQLIFGYRLAADRRQRGLHSGVLPLQRRFDLRIPRTPVRTHDAPRGLGFLFVTRALASGTRLWVPTILIVIAWKLFVNERSQRLAGILVVCGRADCDHGADRGVHGGRRHPSGHLDRRHSDCACSSAPSAFRFGFCWAKFPAAGRA